jgi:hypothetical protein
MKLRSHPTAPHLLLLILLSFGVNLVVFAHDDTMGGTTAGSTKSCKLLMANQLFDGVNFPQTNMAVLVQGNMIKQVGKAKQLRGLCNSKINLGDATILPGFIESHGHITFQNVNKNIVLEHGITTVQDTGGPLMAVEGGKGKLRLLSTGPIIQAPGGYPLNIFGGGRWRV